MDFYFEISIISDDMKEETEDVVGETCALEVLDCRHFVSTALFD